MDVFYRRISQSKKIVVRGKKYFLKEFDHRASQYLVMAQLSLYITVLICVLIKPSGLAANDGVSFYGGHISTVTPYIIGLMVSAYLTYMAGYDLSNKYPFLLIKLALFGIAILILGIIVTPFDASRVVANTHELIGIILFSIEFLITGLLVFINLTITNFFLLIGQIMGGLIAYYYLNPAQGFLLQGELIFEVFFGIILIKNVQYLLSSTQ